MIFEVPQRKPVSNGFSLLSQWNMKCAKNLTTFMHFKWQTDILCVISKNDVKW